MIIKLIDGKYQDKKNRVYNLMTDSSVINGNNKKYAIKAVKANGLEIRAISKKEIYAARGIEYKTGKIYHSYLGWINLLLVNGNEKIGIGCYHYSTLPGTGEYTAEINGHVITEKGTCVCDCVGCYAKTGNYNFPSVKKALLIRTWIIRHDIEFFYNAVSAQIEADNIKYCRIHAAGDFDNNLKYAFTWRRIAQENSAVKIWTYTKIKRFETLFDGLDNANIVKSLIDGIGINYGHCDYIMQTYEKLTAAEKKVHICRCGIDKNQHCINCAGCSENEYVLFIEHSTEYIAEKDPRFNDCKALIESQEKTAVEKKTAA